jgi:hypothetical protein
MGSETLIGLGFFLLIALMIGSGVWAHFSLKRDADRRHAEAPIDDVKVLVAEAFQGLTPLQLEAIDVFAQSQKVGWFWVRVTAERHPLLTAEIARGT